MPDNQAKSVRGPVVERLTAIVLGPVVTRASRPGWAAGADRACPSPAKRRRQDKATLLCVTNAGDPTPRTAARPRRPCYWWFGRGIAEGSRAQAAGAAFAENPVTPLPRYPAPPPRGTQPPRWTEKRKQASALQGSGRWRGLRENPATSLPRSPAPWDATAAVDGKAEASFRTPRLRPVARPSQKTPLPRYLVTPLPRYPVTLPPPAGTRR